MIHTDFVLLSCLLCSLLCFIHIMKWNSSLSKVLYSVVSQRTKLLLSTGLEGLQQIVFKAGFAFLADVMTVFLYASCLWQGVTSLLLTIRFNVSFQNPALCYLAFWISWRRTKNMGNSRNHVLFLWRFLCFFSKSPRAAYGILPFELAWKTFSAGIWWSLSSRQSYQPWSCLLCYLYNSISLSSSIPSF